MQSSVAGSELPAEAATVGVLNWCLEAVYLVGVFKQPSDINLDSCQMSIKNWWISEKKR